MLDTYKVVDDYTYVRFDISSHWPMLDEPEKFNESLLRFFHEHDVR